MSNTAWVIMFVISVIAYGGMIGVPFMAVLEERKRSKLEGKTPKRP